MSIAIGKTKIANVGGGKRGEQGLPGVDGFSPIVTVATNTETEYTLSIQTATGIITTPNLKGQNGQDGTGGPGGVTDITFCTEAEIVSMINTAKGEQL